MEEKRPVYSLIVTIVNRGFSDDVMESARSCGAKGGTIMYAHGAGLDETETFLGLSIHPEKEVVLILAEDEKRPAIMNAITAKSGLRSDAMGVTFSMPVNHIGGVSKLIKIGDED